MTMKNILKFTRVINQIHPKQGLPIGDSHKQHLPQLENFMKIPSAWKKSKSKCHKIHRISEILKFRETEKELVNLQILKKLNWFQMMIINSYINQYFKISGSNFYRHFQYRQSLFYKTVSPKNIKAHINLLKQIG